jgi:hypothetical protein
MTTTREPMDVAHELMAVLNRYIAVHDAMFNAGLGGLFKRMPFDRHHAALNACLADLQRLQQTVVAAAQAVPPQSVRSQQWAAMNAFMCALTETIGKLRDITGVLAGTAEGRPGYSTSAYKAAIAEYQQSVVRYQGLGSELNRQLARTGDPPPHGGSLLHACQQTPNGSGAERLP